MKRCPQCKSTYSDDSLSFCLTDGTALEVDDPAKTEVMNVNEVTSGGESRKTEGRPMRINIPDESRERTPDIETMDKAVPRRGVSPLIVGLLAATVALLVAVIAGIAVYALFFNGGQTGPVANGIDKTIPDDEVEDLRKQVEELANKLDSPDTEAERDTNLKIDQKSPMDDRELDEEYIMRVNSPNDGFLALRSAPDTEKGARLAKIPHGTIITIVGCQSKKVRIGSRTGRWCRAVYEGTSGWVYDAWLVP